MNGEMKVWVEQDGVAGFGSLVSYNVWEFDPHAGGAVILSSHTSMRGAKTVAGRRARFHGLKSYQIFRPHGLPTVVAGELGR